MTMIIVRKIMRFITVKYDIYKYILGKKVLIINAHLIDAQLGVQRKSNKIIYV